MSEEKIVRDSSNRADSTADPRGELRVIELDPEIWMRGGLIGSLLQIDNKKRRQCCIGIACTTFGISDDVIGGQGCVQELDMEAVREVPEFESLVVFISEYEDEDGEARMRDRLDDVYNINDSDDISDDDRVSQTNEELSKLGASFRFVLKGASS